ncbi:MAG: response regulator [Desulfobacterales bacterium]|nr:response regulator [Desulfobacterales bacterium]
MDPVKTSSPLRILLVEDDEHDVVVFRLAFQKSQIACEITKFERAEQALERLRTDALSFDLVVIDHGLPGMSGLDLSKELLDEKIPLPLVILTGRGSEQLAVEALQAGVDDYIIKDPNRNYLDLLPVVLPDVVRRYGDRIARKQVEEELRKINEELKNFAHIVSHDLKTPIVHIQGFSSLLLEDHHEKLEEKSRTCLERIKANAHRMEVLISDLLALSRVGKVVSTFEDVPSFEIIKNLTLDLQDRLEAKGIELVVADNLPTTYCDGERIYQVFENLLVNAIKFMGDTKNPKIEIGCEHMGDFHQFYVRDNGIGIDPKHHREIFERFHRLRETEDEEGTGLGLAIIERIVNNHCGRVWVESEKGRGTTFYFTLPKAS